MTSRRTMMGVSFLVSALVYIAMLLAAPYVTLMEANRSAAVAMNLVSISLREDTPEVTPPPVEENPVAAPSRPGSIEELLSQPGEAPVEAPAGQNAAPAEIPDLAGRVAGEPIAREHELAFDPASLERADAKIIEIDRDTARNEVEVPRRLVRPSPDRILEPGVFPALRSEGFAPGDIPLEPVPAGIGLAPAPGEALAGPPPVAPVTPPVPVPEPVQKAIEAPLADLPIENEVREAKAESDYVFLDDMLDIRVNTYTQPGEPLGFYELVVSPKQGKAVEVIPKDITFVVDASQSVMQRKLDLVCRGLAGVIMRLRPEDYFNLVIFRDNPVPFQPQRVPATEANKAAAVGLLKGLESKSQTDVYKALNPVVMEAPRPGIPGMIFISSDFRPTTGVQNGREIINGLSRDNALRNSIYAFGVGNTVNRYTMEFLAYRNKGRARITPDIEKAPPELEAFYQEFSDPVLTGIQVNFSRIDEEEIYPAHIPDFFTNSGVALYGRFDPAKNRQFVMRMTGWAGDRKKEVVFRAELDKAGKGGSSIPGNWAFAKSYALISEMSEKGETPELLNQLRDLSRKYNVRTSYDQ